MKLVKEYLDHLQIVAWRCIQQRYFPQTKKHARQITNVSMR